jgi:hypothetical protein
MRHCQNRVWLNVGGELAKPISHQFAGSDDLHVVPIALRSNNGTTWKSSLPPTFGRADQSRAKQ